MLSWGLFEVQSEHHLVCPMSCRHWRKQHQFSHVVLFNLCGERTEPTLAFGRKKKNAAKILVTSDLRSAGLGPCQMCHSVVHAWEKECIALSSLNSAVSDGWRLFALGCLLRPYSSLWGHTKASWDTVSSRTSVLMCVCVWGLSCYRFSKYF